MNNLPPVSTQLTASKSGNGKQPAIIDNLTQNTQTAAHTQTSVLRQEANIADYGIVMLLTLVIVYCWFRLGKK